MLGNPPSPRRRILITGASSGLGEQMARIWAAMGRDLALCARRSAELERLRDELLAQHPQRRVVVRALDVNDPEATEEVFADCSAALGGLDRVVANAGVASGGPIGLGHAAANRAVAQTNFVGVLNQAEAALSQFRRAGAGHLVVMSSIAGLRGLGGDLNVYSATKAGVATLAEGLRADLWHSPIRVTAIHPGYIRTAMFDHAPDVKWSVDAVTGTSEIVAAIEREPARAYVPARTWRPLVLPIKLLPMGLYRVLADRINGVR